MSIKQKRQLIDHEFEEINEIRKLKKAELEFETNGKSESAITEVIHLKLEHSSVAKRIKYYESLKVEKEIGKKTAYNNNLNKYKSSNYVEIIRNGKEKAIDHDLAEYEAFNDVDLIRNRKEITIYNNVADYKADISADIKQYGKEKAIDDDLADYEAPNDIQVNYQIGESIDRFNRIFGNCEEIINRIIIDMEIKNANNNGKEIAIDHDLAEYEAPNESQVSDELDESVGPFNDSFDDMCFKKIMFDVEREIRNQMNDEIALLEVSDNLALLEEGDIEKLNAAGWEICTINGEEWAIKYADPAKSKEWSYSFLNSFILNFKGEGIEFYKNSFIEAYLTDPLRNKYN